MLVLDRVAEPRAGELVAHAAQPGLERLEVGDDQPDASSEHLRPPGRQVELLLAGIRPHVLGADHQVRVAGEPQADHVEQGGHDLVRNPHVDVLEREDVADVLAAAVEFLACHHGLPR